LIFFTELFKNKNKGGSTESVDVIIDHYYFIIESHIHTHIHMFVY